jgi:hypothetical protein
MRRQIFKRFKSRDGNDLQSQDRGSGHPKLTIPAGYS